MAVPHITSAFFERMDDPGETGWVVRVMLVGDHFVTRASPLVAQVGDVPVNGLAVMGNGAVGFLKSVPPAGARLRVGYLDLGLNDTHVTFPATPNA